MAIAIPAKADAAVRRRLIWRQIPATIALLPAALIVLVVYVGCMLWTVRISFSSSKLLPKLDWVGFAQYERLLGSTRFIVSLENMVVFGILFLGGCLVLGFLLAVFIDQSDLGNADPVVDAKVLNCHLAPWVSVGKGPRSPRCGRGPVRVPG